MAEVVYPVILSGGAGTRLWPLSRALYPKQLLALCGEQSLLQQTAARVAGDGFAPPLIICNEEHRFVIAEQLGEIGIGPGRIVLEPVGRNTAPAAAVAAILLSAKDPEAIMLLLPSDHTVADEGAFLGAVDTAHAAARGGALVTFGIPPSHPETGYGYIRRASPVAGISGCFEVDRFVEKPDLETARGYLNEGGYDWNSGMFVFAVQAYLEELERFEPDMLAHCRSAVSGAAEDLDFLRLDKAAFAAAPSRSVDYAVMERTGRAATVPVDMGWNDVGSWSALWDIGDKDGDGNVLSGDVIADGTRNSYIHSDARLIAAVGLDGMVVVATDDVVLVVPKEKAQDVRAIVAQLEAAGRTEHTTHSKVYRPWGSYQSIDAGDRFQVKHIVVKPGAKLSVQMHHHRAEHWIVVSGTAKATRGDETILLHEDESTYIPLGVKHSLENPGKVPLRLIEVQTGGYLGEDDIVRFEDRYGRADEKE